MTILFEIEHEQDTSWTRQRIGLLPGIGDNAHEMVRLSDRIGRIAEMISAPEQTRASRGLLPCGVLRIAIETRIARLMNDADNALASHRDKVRPHQVVVRKIDYVTGGKRTRWHHENENGSAQDRKFHSEGNRWADIEQSKRILQVIFSTVQSAR